MNGALGSQKLKYFTVKTYCFAFAHSTDSISFGSYLMALT